MGGEMSDTESEILTAKEVSKLLQVSSQTVRLLAAQNAIPGRKVGKQWRFDRATLLEWVGRRPMTVSDPSGF